LGADDTPRGLHRAYDVLSSANLFFLQPLLTAYELQVALGEVPWADVYPMDYYSSSGGPWSNNVLAHEK
jgi:hypothetical protein